MSASRFTGECYEFGDGYDRVPVTVNHKQVKLMLRLWLPEEVREVLSAIETQHLHGVFEQGFYCVPQIGTTFNRNGHKFRVIDVEQEPTLWRSREVKRIPVVITEYIGVCNAKP